MPCVHRQNGISGMQLAADSSQSPRVTSCFNPGVYWLHIGEAWMTSSLSLMFTKTSGMQVILVPSFSAISKRCSQTKKECSFRVSVLFFSILLSNRGSEPGTVFAEWSHIKSLSFF